MHGEISVSKLARLTRIVFELSDPFRRYIYIRRSIGLD